MKLYHYSTERFAVLLTRRTQGTLTQKELEEAETRSRRMGTIAPYVDHISFFFDPLPLELLASIFRPTSEFKEEHPVWFKGNQLFEHVVEVETLNPNCAWEVVESFKKTKFLDDFSDKHNWVDDNPELLRLYLVEAKKNAVAWGEEGHGLQGLLKQIKLNTGVTERAYQQARARDDFGWGRMKYAANVPHLMFYPEAGKVAVAYTNKVTVGTASRKRL